MSLTAAGYQKRTLAEIRKEIEAAVQVVFGVDADLSPEGPLGQLIAILAKLGADSEERNQELYTAHDKDQATGIPLEDLLKQLGIYRLPATAARISDVLLWLEFGDLVTVPSGSLAKSGTQPASYYLESTVAQVASVTGPFRAVRLAFPSLTVGNILSVTLNGTAYTKTILTGETPVVALGLLANSIVAGAFGVAGGAALYESVDGTDCLRIEAPVFTLNAFSADFTGLQSAQAGIFVASSVGVQAVPALTLDTIVTPVSGWLEIEQPATGTDGTDTETDTSMRLRAIRTIRSGTATEQAIRDAVYSVDGVSKVVVTSNRTSTTDSEGRPPKSFEVVVVGGSDTAIAEAIWNTQPAGILPYGTTIIPVVGSDSDTHEVGFSHPEPKYAWVEVQIIATDPDGGPAADYQQRIKDAVSLYGRENFDLGDNFILQKFYAPVYAVPGIYSVALRTAMTDTEHGSPSYNTINLIVAGREFLTFDASRVVFA